MGMAIRFPYGVVARYAVMSFILVDEDLQGYDSPSLMAAVAILPKLVYGRVLFAHQEELKECGVSTPLQLWYGENSEDVLDFEKQMRRKVHYVIEPDYLWTNIYELARTQNNNLLKTLEKGFKYIENESFDRAFQGLFSEMNLNSDKKRISRPTT